MTFSQKIKNEIANLKIVQKEQIIKYEVLGYISSSMKDDDICLDYVNENKDVIVRYIYILKNICSFVIVEDNDVYKKNKGKKVQYVLNIVDMGDAKGKIDEILKLKDNDCSEEEKAAFLRGVFLGNGYISDPQKDYHLELTFNDKKMRSIGERYLDELDVRYNTMNNKNGHQVIYIKESESISNFLILIGASVGMLDFENARIRKEINNNLNRAINCETANLNKILQTAKRQLDDIEIIKKCKKYNTLSANLQEACELRIENPEASLIELAQILKISKSGLNNRYIALNSIAEELRKKHGKRV